MSLQPGHSWDSGHVYHCVYTSQQVQVCYFECGCCCASHFDCGVQGSSIILAWCAGCRQYNGMGLRYIGAGGVLALGAGCRWPIHMECSVPTVLAGGAGFRQHISTQCRVLATYWHTVQARLCIVKYSNTSVCVFTSIYFRFKDFLSSPTACLICAKL